MLLLGATVAISTAASYGIGNRVTVPGLRYNANFFAAF